jgi:AraC-like DNA-binding protein/ligand-binding sensor protein
MLLKKDEYGFDFEEAKRSVDAYSLSTKMDCFIIDSAGAFLYASGSNGQLCKSCKKICEKAHLYGSYQAERFGGKYVYFCPIGLVYWASPITVGNSIQAALVGGPVLMISAEEFLLDDLIRQSAIDEERIKIIYECIKTVPVTAPDVVNSLSELLCIVASSVSGDKKERHDSQRKLHELQSRISESVHSMKLLAEDSGKKSGYPFEKEKELMSKISMGDKQASQKILNELLGYVFFSSGKDFQVIKARALELVVLLSRAALEGGADCEEIFGLNFNYLSEIHNFRKVEELTFWLSKIMARFTDCVFNLADIRHKDTIFKAIAYIKRNYMNRITLEEVAKHVYLNPSYFSKIFNAEIKSTFVSYINSFRIRAAKELLLDSSTPLAEISSLAGFEDQSYFTKVFKKATGVTPGKFRQSKGQTKGTVLLD